MNTKHALMPAGIALLAYLSTPVATHAACAVVTSIPTPAPEPVMTELAAAGRTTSLAHAAAYTTGGSPETPVIPVTPTLPVEPVITPSSVSYSDAACVADTFGAPLSAQGLAHTRQHLSQSLGRLSRLRGPKASANGLQVYAQADNQARREDGHPDGGYQALRVSRVDVTAGADYRLNERWVAGASVGAGNPRLRWDGSTSRMDGQSGNLTAYGSWSPTAASYVSAAFSVESTHYSLRTEDDVWHATTGVNAGLSLSAGYDIQQGNWSISPYARIDEVSSRIGSFGSEVGSTRGRSGSVSLGTQVQTLVPTSWGVVAPHARVELTQITGWHIQGSSAATYAANAGVLPTPNPLALDRQFGTAGIGAAALLQRGTSLFADYDTSFAQRGVSSWRFTLGLRSEL